MANISPGNYSIQEILDLAGFDFFAKAAAEYNDGGPDYRRVKVGGLGFDSLEDRLAVPEAATEVVIALDGEPDTVLSVA